MDNATRILIYFVVFLLFQLSGPPSLSNEQLKAVAEYLDIARAELDTLANVTLSEFSERHLALSALNFTNVKESTPENCQQLHPVELEAAVDALWRRTNGCVYAHPNAALTGDIIFNASLPSNALKLPIFNEEEPPEWAPVTQPLRASMSLRLQDRQMQDGKSVDSGQARILIGSVSLVPDVSYNKGPLPLTDIPVRGVYLESGRFIASTTSLKFQGPAVIPYVLGRDDARIAMLEYLNSTVPDQLDVYDAWQYLDVQRSRALELPELFIYGQTRLDGSSELTKDDLNLIERELTSPEGAPLPEIPRLISDVVIWSPDAGLNGSAQSAAGVRTEVLLAKRRHVLLALLVVYVALTALMGGASVQLASPSRAGKCSLWTAALMALMDATTCMTQAVAGREDSAPLTMAVAIFAFVLTVWFELDLVTRIYSAHANESALVDYQTQRIANEQNEGEERAPAQPTAEYVGEREISGRIYGRFYLALFVLFVSALLFSHSRTSRYRFEMVVLIVFYSYWAPQIWRSMSKGSQVPLDTAMMWEIAGLRLIPLIYVSFVKGNVFDHHNRPVLGSALVLWQCLQVSVLSLQRRYGPRFFLPRSWTIEGYDYHRLLNDDIEQQDTTLAAPRTSGQDQVELGFNENIQSYCRLVSCAICMEAVTLPIHRDGPVSPALEGERQKYMITPCRHVFHTECLEQWMESKLQCPVCRSPLPPI